MNKKLFLYIFIILFSFIKLYSQPNVGNIDEKDIDSTITKIMNEWKVPGLSIAIVKNDSVIFLKGYGYRDINKKIPVNGKTLFGIASCTKAFTCTALGILVDRNKLNFNKLVKEIIPEFKLSDDYATNHITVRDLITHQSGLPRHDRLWYMSPLSRYELMQRMQYLEMSKDLHQTYQYNNLMYVVAGIVIEKIENTTWEDFVKKNILIPLEMKNTYLSINDLMNNENHALPYGEILGKIDTIPYCNLDAAGPCGSINSCAEDMAKWLAINMNSGKYKNTTIISENTLKEIHSPQILSSKTIDYDELYYSLYGMGWGINKYRDHLLYSHSGSIDGYASLVTFLPKEKLGIVILTNLEGNTIHRTIAYYIFDKFLGLEPINWFERAKERDQKNKISEENSLKKDDSLKVKNTKPSHNLSSYVGEYDNPAYGKVSVKLENGKLKLYYNNYSYDLEHYHYDVFIANKPDWQDRKKIKFEMNKNGEINTLLIPFEPTVNDITFRKLNVVK